MGVAAVSGVLVRTAELRQAMLDHYLPRQGPEFETWLDELDALGARIVAEKMFTFSARG